MHREITVKGVRHGAPVEFPMPAPLLIDHNGVVETLVDQQVMVLESPKSSLGQQYRVFSAQAKFRYLLDRPLTVTERYRMGNDISLQSEPEDNAVSGLALFGKGRIEHHGTIIPASPGDPVVSDVLPPTLDNFTVGRPLV